MQLIGQPTQHGTLGKGVVTKWNDALQREVPKLLDKREAAKKERALGDESQECAEDCYLYYCKRNRLQPKHREEVPACR